MQQVIVSCESLSYSSLLLISTAEQSELGRVEVEYLTMPGWKTSIAHSKSISDLPPNAKAYVEKIWELTGIPGTVSIQCSNDVGEEYTV